MKKDIRPPKNFQRFFEWFCHSDYYEELQGDMEETFYQNVEQESLGYARKVYRKEVLKMLRPSVIKKLRLPALISRDMMANYFKIAFRNLVRHKFFSTINLAGLAIGMCLSLLVIAMINDLSKFDEFHANKDQIYRVVSTAQVQNWEARELATSSMPLAEQIKSAIPGVKETIRIRRYFSGEVSHEKKTLSLRGHLVDENFLSVFSFPLLEGDPQSALSQPHSIVLTATAVEKLFGNQNVIGELIEVDGYGTFAITGVAEDPPIFSHIQFEMLGSFSTIPILEKEEKIYPTLNSAEEYNSNYTYLLLPKNQNPKSVEASINDIAQDLYAPIEDISMKVELQSLRSIVPGPDLNNQIGPKMPYIVLIIFSIVALVVLLSACFNYTNLSIARSLKRAREIGVRKVIGAEKGQIVAQFLCESILIALLSVALSIGLFQFIKQGFLDLMPRSEIFLLELSPQLIALFAGYALLAGFAAGAFPAFYLSSMKPTAVLKNLVNHRLFKKLTARKALIVFQFVLSTAFIIATTIIYRQYTFAIHKDLGFQKENILNVFLDDVDPDIFKSEFSKIPEVKQISFASQIPGSNSTSAVWVQIEEGKDSMGTYYMNIDEQFIDNHQLQLISGKGFLKTGPDKETGQLIINEQFLGITPWESPDEAIGGWVTMEGIPHQITGVIKNFNYTHIEEPIKSFCFRYKPEGCHIANLKIASQDIPATMKKLESTWSTIEPVAALNARFLDEHIEATYQFLVNIISIFGFVAFLAITIACLGLLGMAVYTMETKVKEISLRKIFGASRGQLVLQLSRSFITLLLIASVIAIPLTFLLFDQVVLNNFAFRIDIGLLELSSGFLLIFAIGILTIGSQTWKAANSNPAEHLRGE